MTSLCIEAWNENERDSRDKDLWVEWHNAYLNRVDKMPMLSELLNDGKSKDKSANVGRDLMNALLGGFRANIVSKSSEEITADEPARSE